MSLRVIHPKSPENVLKGKIPQSPEVAAVAAAGVLLRAQGLKWWDVADQLRIIGPDLQPSPGLASLIIEQGYEPTRIKTRTRLGFSPVCPECHQEVRKPKRHVLPWVTVAANWLQAHEQADPIGPRVYKRGATKCQH